MGGGLPIATMLEVRRTFGDNVIIFAVSTTDALNINVTMMWMNGMRVSSGRMFRAKTYMKVMDWLDNVVVDEDFCIKYRVRLRIEPNPPKKGEGYERIKVHTLHLRKWSSITNKFERTGISSHFHNLLSKHMHGQDEGMRYDIEVGAVRFVNIALSQLGKAAINGLARASLNTPVIMRGANGRSKKIVKATSKMR